MRRQLVLTANNISRHGRQIVRAGAGCGWLLAFSIQGAVFIYGWEGRASSRFLAQSFHAPVSCASWTEDGMRRLLSIQEFTSLSL